MTNKHETPEVLKTKLKEEVALITKLKAELQTAEQRLQDVIGAYILGAGLPQQGIRFDDSFDLIYEESAAVEIMDNEEEETSTASTMRQPEMTASRSNKMERPKIR